MRFRLSALLLLLGASIGLAGAEPVQPIAALQAAKHGRGYKAPPPEVTKAHHDAAFARHGHKLKDLPPANQPVFDCATAFKTLGGNDQGPCGDCFGVGTTDGASDAIINSGVLPFSESSRLSSQYGLDSGAFSGGCNGGDPAQVVTYLASTGFPLTKDYGPYSASPGRLKDTSGMPFYKVGQWGYAAADQGVGIATTQQLKNSMQAYGVQIVCVDAAEFDNYSWPGTMTGKGQNVDHVVLCVAWDDNHDNGDGTKGAFLGQNQWGPASPQSVTFQSQPWGGPQSTFWIAYGADSWGTEAIWVSGGVMVPPVGPGPGPGPGPTPPPTTCTPYWHWNGRPHMRCDPPAMGAQFTPPCGPIRKLLGRCPAQTPGPFPPFFSPSPEPLFAPFNGRLRLGGRSACGAGGCN